MFRADRWADAFINTCGENPEEAFNCLKSVSVPLSDISGTASGHSAALRVEKLIRECAGDVPGEAPGIEYAIRFISLLTAKNRLKHINKVINEIEIKMDSKNNVLNITAESAFQMDGAFEDELKRHILEKTGASGIKMNVVIVPELLGGYRLRMNGFYIDASLKGQIDKMTIDLTREAV